jgi:hypothetical protein
VIRYAVIRFGGGGRMELTGVDVPPWESLSSVMFSDPNEAWAFARRLDRAQVFLLVPVADVDNTPERGTTGNLHMGSRSGPDH